MRKHLEDAPRARAVERFTENLQRLTPREREILEYMLHADTAKDIARSLKLAVGTAKNLRSRVLEKLDARNSLELLYISHEAAQLAEPANDDEVRTGGASHDAGR